MGNLKDVIAVACDECNGAGFVFFGDENQYDVETCDCQETPSLFLSEENK